MEITTSRALRHMVATAEDFEYGFQSLIRNIQAVDRLMVSANSDYVCGGVMRPAGGLYFTFDAVWANGKDLKLPVFSLIKSSPTEITAPLKQPRHDTVQIRGELESFDMQMRGFFDPELEIVKYFDVDTKNRLVAKVQVKQGVEGSLRAPEADPGWVKLGEIYIKPDTVELKDENIKNITARVEGEKNTLWSSEYERTFLVKGLMEWTAHLKEKLEELKERGTGGGSGDTGGDSGDGSGDTDPNVPVLINIVITSLPSRISFYVDDKFDPTGLVVMGILSDGSIKSIYPELPPENGSTGYILSEPDMSTAGEKEIVVMYQGFTASFTITVAKPLTEFERFIKGFMRQPLLPVTFTYTNGPTHGMVNWAFAGGVLLPDGRVVFVPHSSVRIGIYNPVANTYTSGPGHGRGSNGFGGGVLLPDSRVVFVPRRSTNIGIYDPVANTYTDGPTHGRGGSAFNGGVLLPDGRVVMVPFQSTHIGILLMPGLETGLQYALSPFINKF